MLADDDKLRLFFLCYGFQRFRNRQRLQLVVGKNMYTAIRAHGQCGADGLGALFRTHRDRDHFGRHAGFFQTDGFFDGDLVERVHRHFDILSLNTRAIGLHPNFHVVVDDPFDRDQDFHKGLVSAFR